LLRDVDLPPGPIHVAGGKALLKQRVNGYNHAARYRPWIVLVDLNHEADCAPALRAAWLSKLAEHMCFRVAVHEVEAWLLADRQQMATFLGVNLAKIPQTPDSLDDPKRTMVNLARHSSRKDVREDMVPRPNSGRSEGPAYASRLIEFVHRMWSPSAAEAHSDSLRRCRLALLGIREVNRDV